MFEIREVKTKKDLNRFIDLPFRLYKGSRYWVPPIRNDEFKQLQPEYNPSFKSTTARFWTAWNGKQCVGRLGALVMDEPVKGTIEKTGRLTRMEFIDDVEVSQKLFEVAENWFRDQGIKTVSGPLGFNNLDNQGVLIEGFDHLPSVASVYHHPYYQAHFERAGYQKENDWVEFRLTLGEAPFKKASRGAEIVKKRYGFTVKSFVSSKELHAYALPVFHLMNRSFQDLPYVSRLSDEMIGYISKKYLKVLDPRFVKMIFLGDELVAFIIGMPSLSKAMQKANGRLFPFGLLHILKAMRNPEVIDLLLTAVAPEHHTSGAAVILFAELQAEMMKQGITQMETTGIFETNHNVISNWKNYEHIQHKRRRCYVKELL
jgi:hypothetical protein